MRISIVQSALHWEDPASNRAMFEAKLLPLKGQTDLVVLPEMFSTGFSMNASNLAEPMDGPTVDWMRSVAATLDAAVTGSFICSDGGKHFNRLLFMRPDGSFDLYDKKHLFGMSGEDVHFEAGNKKTVLEWKGWNICPLICYDLRFPAWSRNIDNLKDDKGNADSGRYDLLIYVANWPSRRAHHWRSLLIARAIENQCFVAGANIAGTDGNGFDYTGDSAVIEFSGQPLVQIPDGKEGIVTVSLDRNALLDYRKQLPFLNDGDRFVFTG